MLRGAIWATGLPGYGRLPAVPAEARFFQLGAIFSSSGTSSLLPFLYGEADSFWFLGRFRLCGFGRRWF